ncbi:DNA methylase N-4 [Mycobacterium sp. djl-10]|nr:DNA methylase N-4 [Mycobacterium sp. djl-10]
MRTDQEIAEKAYTEFLADKVRFDSTFGFEVSADDVHPILKPHQRDIVRWAVQGGRRAIFASFGLGKSVMQLEILRLTLKCRTEADNSAASERYGNAFTPAGPGMPGLKALIVCPLGVRQEFVRDAEMLGLTVRFIRSTAELVGLNAHADIYLTNYESVREGKVDVSWFTAVSLDEASVLRSFGSKTYQTFLPLFDGVPYRFVATATPSPNRYKELIHYAGFLGVMDTGQALTRFFQRDSTKANNLTLYPHKQREFWLWLNTWAVFVQKPSDLGHPDDGYDLPELDVRWQEIDVDHSTAPADRDGQGILFRGGKMSTVTAAREKRETLEDRVAKACELVNEAPEDHFILWHDLEDERRALKAAIPEAVEVFGTLDLDEREQRVIDFADGRHRILATKPSLSGSGCNFQRHCHRAIFVGVGFSFNDFIQSIHRLQRFQQQHTVRIDIIYAESEREVVRTLQQKWAEHRELTATMSEIIREFGLAPTTVAEALQRSIGVDRIEASGERWLAANNDCVAETETMQDNSVDLIVTSIPFANHYEYTPSYNDFGHTDDNTHFWAQMDYLTPQLLRILAPGRIYACHVKDRILFGNVTGAGVPTVSPFHAEAIFHGRRHGFDYLGMITVVTDVVRENNQTYRLGWSEQCKDGTKMGVGSPEYILLFHKPQTDRSKGYADTPVTKSKDTYTRARWQVDAHAFWRSSGNRILTADELAALPADQLSRLFTDQTLREVYDYESHIKVGEQLDGRGSLPATFMSLAPGSWAPEVWHDVNRMLTLNTTQSQRAQQMHVCPLQFDIVDRLISRFSNPDELVFDPFGGLMTVPVRALKLGRRGRGVELNPGYYLDGVKYLQAEERVQDMPTLFDIDEAS